MTASTTTPTATPYAVVTIEGIEYKEQAQLFVLDVVVSAQLQVFTNQRLTLPGVANFLLKGLSRDITGYPQTGPPTDIATVQEAFRFKLYNSEGTTWFFSGGLGIFDDRVFDNMCFGSGQFPFPLIPPIPVQANGSLIFELEDMGFRVPSNYPYTVHLGFHGAYLIPLDQPAAS
jgi:hypothetical protein